MLGSLVCSRRGAREGRARSWRDLVSDLPHTHAISSHVSSSCINHSDSVKQVSLLPFQRQRREGSEMIVTYQS